MKKLFNRQQTKPEDYFSEVKSAQKQEKPAGSHPATTSRRDVMLPSRVLPARESVLGRRTLRSAVGIMLGLVILGMILFAAIGPGRPMLEQGLMSLANQAVTPTPTSTSSLTPLPTTSSPIYPTYTASFTPTKLPTSTPRPTSTFRPTSTPLIQATASATQILITHIPAAQTCREASSITLADVGQTLCVKGIVLRTISNPTDFMVLFSFEHGAFYWVTYDLVWKQGEVNMCYQLEGKIRRLGNNPIMVFDYGSLPEECP